MCGWKRTGARERPLDIRSVHLFSANGPSHHTSRRHRARRSDGREMAPGFCPPKVAAFRATEHAICPSARIFAFFTRRFSRGVRPCLLGNECDGSACRARVSPARNNVGRRNQSRAELAIGARGRQRRAATLQIGERRGCSPWGDSGTGMLILDDSDASLDEWLSGRCNYEKLFCALVRRQF